jgi:hypothetical protein
MYQSWFQHILSKMRFVGASTAQHPVITGNTAGLLFIGNVNPGESFHPAEGTQCKAKRYADNNVLSRTLEMHVSPLEGRAHFIEMQGGEVDGVDVGSSWQVNCRASAHPDSMGTTLDSGSGTLTTGTLTTNTVSESIVGNHDVSETPSFRVVVTRVSGLVSIGLAMAMPGQSKVSHW